MGHLDAHHVLVNYQHGFRRGYSCESQLITTAEHLARNLDHGKQTDVLLLDFSKAFDTAPHKRLLKKLDHYGIRGQLLKWIESWPYGRTQTVVANGSQSSPVTVTSGVPQGTVLGPLRFLLYINDFGLQITSELDLFADDSVLYGVVNNISSAEVLQSDLNKLVVWSEKWQMAFNASKCFLLRVTCSRDNVVNYTYTMMGQPITSVTQDKYLGVELDSKLTWNEHIAAITGRANSSLGFLRRNLYNCPEQIKTQAYHSLVRPTWIMHARCGTHIHKRIFNQFTKSSAELKWPSLEQRRKQTRLTNLYKIVNGTLAVEIPDYFRQKERQTRNYHPLKFINADCRTNIYKYSFFRDPLKNGTNFPEQLLKLPTQRPSSLP